jgi:hypothetical protein
MMRAIATYLIIWLICAANATADVPDLAGWTRTFGRTGLTFTAGDGANGTVTYNLPPRIASLWAIEVTFNREAMRAAGARGSIIARQGAMAMGDFTTDTLTVKTKSGRTLRLIILGWETQGGLQLAIVTSPATLAESDPRLGEARTHAINLSSARESVEP